MKKDHAQTLEAALKGPAFERRIRIRNLKDRLSAKGITVGGIAVIASVLLIMFFLMYVVMPLFSTASVEKSRSIELQNFSGGKTLYYAIDEYKETAVRFTSQGKAEGVNLESGLPLEIDSLPLAGQKITSFAVANEAQNLLVFGLEDGSALVTQYGYKVTYPNNIKTITPELKFPFGESPVELGTSALQHVALRDSESGATFVFKEDNSNQVEIKRFSKESSMFGDDVVLEEDSAGAFTSKNAFDHLLLDGSGRNLYLTSKSGETQYYDLSDASAPELIQELNLLKKGEEISTIRFLIGDYSLMVGTSKGNVYQWFPVRNKENQFQLQFIRDFAVSGSAIDVIAVEHARKGFATLDANGQFDLLHSTSERHLESFKVELDKPSFISFSPRADGALVESADGKLVLYKIENEHPDVSMKSLWGEVWYEGYEEPSYTWQSSSASSDFEPKFSLMPLTWGTIKAALYSMLFAVPLAVLGAIYTAFFMDKSVRQVVKPAVEMIEALPTVILGFLAGLWLAPYMEANLSGFFAIIVVVPLGILMFGYAWSRLPEKIRLMVPVGKRAVLMIPVVAFLGWLSMALNNPLENLFFNGDMRHWLTFSAGIDFDQRNAMVIGFAMGFALIPTIFSIAEDAIYNVPSFLVNGSLALGASGWQTMVGVVLPTASPGIFSAIMLGFGRGIGETMIVLMASGNTPLMNVNIFEGMRTLSANLAVEMPEAEVYSSHYRVLFLSGLVLFIFTFIFNTLAEVVRERMRRKYGSL